MTGMFAVHEKPKNITRALLAAACWPPQTPEDARSLLEELAELVDTLGLEVADSILARINKPQSGHLIGSGKAQEIVDRARELGCDVIIFDNELSPGQQRKWEELSGMAVIDREEVILDIFGGRARTREARLQVELARMEYSLPRLARAWGHLSRQQGIGGKGEGESQLETDRRLVRRRIDQVKSELEEVRSQRATQRKQRERVPLPHRLVESFKATLEEATLSDFLVHLLDATQPEIFAFHRTTMEVLAELGAPDKKILTVFNKVDLLPDRSALNPLRRHFPEALFISTVTGEGLDELLHRMEQELADRFERVELVLPADRADLLSGLHRHGQVLSTAYLDDGAIRVHAVVPLKWLAQYAPYRQDALAAEPIEAALSGV